MLGPLFFTIYASPVVNIARNHGLSVRTYADDTRNALESSNALDDAHNIFFSVNMCNIYFLILIYLTVQFKCIQIQSF